MANSGTSTNPRPGLWLRMSIVSGNSVQLAGLVLGAFLMYLAANLQVAGAVRVALMLGGG